MTVNTKSTELKAYLFKDVLLSHQFLSLPIGFIDHDLQHVLPTVGDVHHKENQIF